MSLPHNGFSPDMACFYSNMTVGVQLFEDGRLYCPKGFYCPNSNTNNKSSTPRICPASIDCGIKRLAGILCEPQGPFEPEPCPQSYYCPSSDKKLICPKGYYCPLGSFEPKICSGISYCPQGSFKNTTYDGLIACIVIDIFLLIGFFIDYFVKNRISIAPKDKESVQTLLNSSFEELVKSFKRGLNGKQIVMDFQFRDMSLDIANKKILDGVNGSINSSRITAIMGPSGAGKTTFMNVLCGKIPRTKGSLSISGKISEIHQYKKMIGYVPQEDVMLRELTVRNILLHAARTKLPHAWKDFEKQNYVDVILETLNLSHVQHVRIGDEITRGISGGQRKRVNIGIELCSIPTCLFLDEPTSGLDATAALEVCNLLRQIAKLGLTIVAVIHQPRVEIFEKIDDLFLIAPGGKTVYLGPREKCQSYFENLGFYFDQKSNPADVLMDVLSGKGRNDCQSYSVQDLVNLWKEKELLRPLDDGKHFEHNEFHELAPSLIEERGSNFFVQLWYCHYRSLVQQVALKNSLLLEIFVGIFAGLVMGISLQEQDYLFVGILIEPITLISPTPLQWVIPLMSFLMGVTATLAAAPAAVKVFSEERAVFWREASAGHSKLAYFLGKNISVIYRSAICSLHFATILHLLARPIISIYRMYLIVFLLYFGIYGISAVISMLVDRQNAPLLGVIVCLFHSVTAGFGLSYRQLSENNLGWLYDIGFNRWISEIIWSESVLPFSHIYMVTKSSEYWGFTLDRAGFDITMAFALGITWRLIAFSLMVLLNRDKQN